MRRIIPGHEFQSAPLTEVRGDVAGPVNVFIDIVVSIRSPYRSKGRFLRFLCHAAAVFRFNPLPLPK